MLTSRQQNLLLVIIESYIRDAQPLASKFLVQQIQEAISSATIRNELVNLEKEGYIFQPHTSAGRIPTEKAYEFYVAKRVKLNKQLALKMRNELEQEWQEDENRRLQLKRLAKKVSDFSSLAVVVAFDEKDNYYTGLENLFKQPEFADRDLIVQFVEEFDQVVRKLYQCAPQTPEILIGKKSYFGNECSFIPVKKGKVLFGLIGPTRMNYQKAYSLIKAVASLIE